MQPVAAEMPPALPRVPALPESGGILGCTRGRSRKISPKFKKKINKKKKVKEKNTHTHREKKMLKRFFLQQEKRGGETGSEEIKSNT